jgi:hypothetical protein
MRQKLALFVYLLTTTAMLFAQADRGTITGTIADPAGAVVPGAPIELRNIETGSSFKVASTETGNYTAANLPAGTYEMTVNVSGFKKYNRTNIQVQVAQTLRLDVPLEVGSSTESVTVTAEATLLKTESGDLSHNVESSRMNNLPMLGLGEASAGTSGIRNPLAVTMLAPGTYYKANADVRVNGAPSNSQSIRVEGMDAGNSLMTYAQAQTQPSVDSIQELSIQTSNFAAEFGQAGGGVFNLTMKGGGNGYHGTVYDYFVNEFMNAAQPHSDQYNNGATSLIRQRQRRQDWGFTIGGPITIPKLYNGKDKTFFFFNWERFQESQFINNQQVTVPTAAYRAGNFAGALTNRQLALDPLGRPIMEGSIYDPSTTRLAPNGARVRDLFPGNIIPQSLFDPVAVKVQGLIPNPTNASVQNNGIYPYPSERVTRIPSLKLDHSLTPKAKLSFYWSTTKTASQFSPTRGASEGFPDTITATRGTFIGSKVMRLNFDYTLTPTTMLHLGAGYQDNRFDDHTAKLDVDPLALIGLKGGVMVRQFPTFTGLNVTGRGGVQQLGPGGQALNLLVKPSANASLTWVKGNHTYKFGGDFRIEGYPTYTFTNVNGNFAFTGAQTGLPSTQGQNLGGGTVGFPYASFLLGLVDNGNIAQPPAYRAGKQYWSAFAQDTWKVTRKLTLDYGLRWDLSTYAHEQYGRGANFSPTTPNPAAGGRLGASIYEATCNCNFAKTYPFGFGPRIGLAYQINPKTVLRAGFGVNYFAGSDRGIGQVTSTNPFANPSFGDAAMRLQDGIPIKPVWPNLSAGQFPLPGTITGAPQVVDQNSGRGARQAMWSIGLQREVSRNLVVEASYVGNRGVWWRGNALLNPNIITPDRIRAFGLDPNSTADLSLMTLQLNNAQVVARGLGNPAYTGFSTSNTLAQSMRPFPQFGNITVTGAPIGNTWYDSLQTKVTKRFSHGIDFTYTFTWQKELTLGVEADQAGLAAQTNDITNRQVNKYLSGYSKPFVSLLAINYTMPKLAVLGKYAGFALRDWQVGGVFSQSSGLPIRVPNSNNQLNNVLFRSTFANRVAGQPLFLKDMNASDYDPNSAFVLNKAAWSDPAPGQFGTSAAYYNDYRYQRRPDESVSIGRLFRIRERKTLQIRAEFSNAFNRLRYQDPVNGSAAGATFTTTQVTDTSAASKRFGLPTGGFGWVNTAVTSTSPNNIGNPRSGTLVARFTF